MIKLGSLFDGIGGFPLAGSRHGFTPVWASEIEPFPIRVTQTRFPDMLHYGDITKLDGGKMWPVDVVTGGSPCQDLSVAGKRAGLAGARSGLFMEQIRIVREMRERTDGVHPRFMVWENVPGALSSNGGEDFRAVLEETCRIGQPGFDVPGCPDGPWHTCGCIMGDGWSVAWRVIDAQYWGVPQRRRRILLVGDFGGTTSAEILFKRTGCKGHFAKISEGKLRGRGRSCVGCLSTRTGTYDRQELDTLVYDYERNTVRLLTPLEEGRLQGFPDRWCDIPGARDSVQYKAYGNSVAIPCVEYVMEGIAEVMAQ